MSSAPLGTCPGGERALAAGAARRMSAWPKRQATTDEHKLGRVRSRCNFGISANEHVTQTKARHPQPTAEADSVDFNGRASGVHDVDALVVLVEGSGRVVVLQAHVA